MNDTAAPKTFSHALFLSFNPITQLTNLCDAMQ